MPLLPASIPAYAGAGTVPDVANEPPRLRISESAGNVRLGFDGFGNVEGRTLQEAADALVARMLNISMALRSSGIGPVYAITPDFTHLEFIWRLGDHVAAGGDPRDLLFGADASMA